MVTRRGELRMVWDSVAWLLRWMVGWVSDMTFEKRVLMGKVGNPILDKFSVRGQWDTRMN